MEPRSNEIPAGSSGPDTGIFFFILMMYERACSISVDVAEQAQRVYRRWYTVNFFLTQNVSAEVINGIETYFLKENQEMAIDVKKNLYTITIKLLIPITLLIFS